LPSAPSHRRGPTGLHLCMNGFSRAAGAIAPLGAIVTTCAPPPPRAIDGVGADKFGIPDFCHLRRSHVTLGCLWRGAEKSGPGPACRGQITGANSRCFQFARCKFCFGLFSSFSFLLSTRSRGAARPEGAVYGMDDPVGGMARPPPRLVINVCQKY